jgi:hypothetical protein
VIQEQQAWLQSTGFETLAQQFQGGRAITGTFCACRHNGPIPAHHGFAHPDEDVQMATAGYTAHQRRAVATRANVLNEYGRGANRQGVCWVFFADRLMVVFVGGAAAVVVGGGGGGGVAAVGGGAER